MYEKVVNHFEKNLCIENLYFRRKYKLWIIGIIIIIVLELIINYIVSIIVQDLWIRVGIILIIDFFITGLFLILAYVIPVKKIYKEKIRSKTSIDIIGLLMKEEDLSAYREIEIQEMDNFIRKECKIKNIESINIIVGIINEEIKEKYEKKSFIEKYFNTTILPVLILVLTVYFTNNNELEFINILSTTIIAIIGIILAGNFALGIKNINITPVNKRENLLELKIVLMDLQIQWKSINKQNIGNKNVLN